MSSTSDAQRVFVTGATGVLGRRVVRQLIDSGHSVTAVARNAEKANQLRQAGANPVTIDLFDAVALKAAFVGHDSVANLATSIPTGMSAANPFAWKANDRLRRDASRAICTAAGGTGIKRVIQESITFPYTAAGSTWINEDHERTYCKANQTVQNAEEAALGFALTDRSAPDRSAVVLRFGMFMAAESAHMNMVLTAARKGVFGLIGDLDSYISFIHADDAAAAVVAALHVPSGIYNVTESEPTLRSAHRDILSDIVRRRLKKVPAVVVKLGGGGADSMSRSQRISSQRLQEVSSWKAHHHCIDSWSTVPKEST